MTELERQPNSFEIPTMKYNDKNSTSRPSRQGPRDLRQSEADVKRETPDSKECASKPRRRRGKKSEKVGPVAGRQQENPSETKPPDSPLPVVKEKKETPEPESEPGSPQEMTLEDYRDQLYAERAKGRHFDRSSQGSRREQKEKQRQNRGGRGAIQQSLKDGAFGAALAAMRGENDAIREEFRVDRDDKAEAEAAKKRTDFIRKLDTLQHDFERSLGLYLYDNWFGKNLWTQSVAIQTVLDMLRLRGLEFSKGSVDQETLVLGKPTKDLDFYHILLPNAADPVMPFYDQMFFLDDMLDFETGRWFCSYSDKDHAVLDFNAVRDPLEGEWPANYDVYMHRFEKKTSLICNPVAKHLYGSADELMVDHVLCQFLKMHRSFSEMNFSNAFNTLVNHRWCPTYATHNSRFVNDSFVYAFNKNRSLWESRSINTTRETPHDDALIERTSGVTIKGFGLSRGLLQRAWGFLSTLLSDEPDPPATPKPKGPTKDDLDGYGPDDDDSPPNVPVPSPPPTYASVAATPPESDVPSVPESDNPDTALFSLPNPHPQPVLLDSFFGSESPISEREPEAPELNAFEGLASEVLVTDDERPPNQLLQSSLVDVDGKGAATGWSDWLSEALHALNQEIYDAAVRGDAVLDPILMDMDRRLSLFNQQVLTSLTPLALDLFLSQLSEFAKNIRQLTHRLLFHGLHLPARHPVFRVLYQVDCFLRAQELSEELGRPDLHLQIYLYSNSVRDVAYWCLPMRDLPEGLNHSPLVVTYQTVSEPNGQNFVEAAEELGENLAPGRITVRTDTWACPSASFAEVWYSLFFRPAHCYGQDYTILALLKRLGRPVAAPTDMGQRLILEHSADLTFPKIESFEDHITDVEVYESFLVNMPIASRRKHLSFFLKRSLSQYPDDLSRADTAFTKSDEILANPKGRIIINPPPDVFYDLISGLVELKRVFKSQMFHRLHADKCVIYWTYGADLTTKQKGEWRQRAEDLCKAGNVLTCCLIVGGDDNLCLFGCQGAYYAWESDVTACDQSHNAWLIQGFGRILLNMGMPGEWVERLKKTYWRKLYVKKQLEVSFEQPQLHTGHPQTSLANTVVVSLVAAILCREVLCPLVERHQNIKGFPELAKAFVVELGMEWKIELHKNALDATFHKGFWVRSDRMYQWLSLPSCLWKTAKLRVDQRLSKKELLRRSAFSYYQRTIMPNCHLVRRVCERQFAYFAELLNEDGSELVTKFHTDPYYEKILKRKQMDPDTGSYIVPGERATWSEEDELAFFRRRYGAVPEEWWHAFQGGFYQVRSDFMDRAIERDFASDSTESFLRTWEGK